VFLAPLDLKRAVPWSGEILVLFERLSCDVMAPKSRESVGLISAISAEYVGSIPYL
jgi:hypothetical protein